MLDHNSLWNTEELHWNQRKDLGPNTLMLMATKEVDLGSNTLVAIFQNLGSNTLMAIKEADLWIALCIVRMTRRKLELFNRKQSVTHNSQFGGNMPL